VERALYLSIWDIQLRPHKREGKENENLKKKINNISHNLGRAHNLKKNKNIK
jgi:hypothetical protein